MKNLLITSALILSLSVPVFAETTGPNVEQPPVKEEPPKETPNLPGKGDRDRSEAPVEAQHWTGTCERRDDGKIYVHTAFMRNQEIAHRQCRERIEAQENN